MNFNWLKKRYLSANATDNSLERASCLADSPLIELAEVVKAFEVEAGTFYALRGVDLSVRCGEFVAVKEARIGPDEKNSKNNKK